MPDRVQDLTNHRKVAVACKNYTDKEVKKAKDELITLFSKNTVETDDHTNELAYQITAPSGAKLLQLMSVGGNTVKLSPSVASDSTKAMIKTMPATVYTFDGSKFYGDSKVSENLYVLTEVAQTTTNYGITYKVENGVIYLSGTVSSEYAYANAFIELNLVNTIPSGTYAVGYFNSTANSTVYVYNSDLENNGDYTLAKFLTATNMTSTGTMANGIKQIRLRLNRGNTYNIIIKPMLVKGSTAPTEFKVGFEGIHNFAWNGVKVEGANKINQTDELAGYSIDSTTGEPIQNSVNGCSNTFIQVLPSTTYTLSTKSNCGNLRISEYSTNDTSGHIQRTQANSANTYTFTTTANTRYIKWSLNYNNQAITQSVLTSLEITLNNGSTALPYEPYVSQTLPIDLSTILYNGSPLFEGNSLKGVNTVKDSITPYLATKKMSKIVLDNTNNWYVNSTWSSENNLSCYIPMTTQKNGGASIISDNNISVVSGAVNSSTQSQYRLASDTIYLNLVGVSTLDAFKSYLQSNPITLYYELATPIEVSIDWSSTLRGIQGYPNGSIIAENTHNMEVESVITYNSIIQETLCPSVTVEGANKLNITDVSQTTVNGLTYKVINDEIYLNGTTNANTNIWLTIQEITLNGTYYFKDFQSGTLGNFARGLYKNNVAKQNLSVNAINMNNVNANQLLYYIPSGQTFTNAKLTPMLVLGSTAPTSFKPYKAPITRNLPTITSDGYGINADAHNLRVFSDYEGNTVNKRYTNVNKEDLGNINYIYSTSIFRGSLSTIKIIGGNDTPNMLSKNYTTDTPNNVYNCVSDKTIASSTTTTQVWVNDTFYTDTTIFKTANVGNPLYYELADTSKTESDMDDFDYFFDVEEGDVITFNNTYTQQVYATYSFIIKEAKSNE